MARYGPGVLASICGPYHCVFPTGISDIAKSLKADRISYLSDKDITVIITAFSVSLVFLSSESKFSAFMILFFHISKTALQMFLQGIMMASATLW